MLRLEQAFDAPARGAPRAPTPAETAPAPVQGAADFPGRAQTLLDVLQWHADRAGARCHVATLRDEQAPQTLSHAELLGHARSVAAALQRSGLAPDEAVALMLPTSQSFLECFMGILLAGGVPVPIYPPFRASQIEKRDTRPRNRSLLRGWVIPQRLAAST